MRYTKKEDSIIVMYIKASPMNIGNAFKAASKVLGRSKHSISQRYYNKIRHSETIFTIMVDGKKVSKNSKIYSNL